MPDQQNLAVVRPLNVADLQVSQDVSERADFDAQRYLRKLANRAQRVPSGTLPWAFKCLIERLAAFAILIALTPFLIGIAIAVRLDSRGPVFFKQPRFGANNTPFNVFKFRTMFADMGDVSGGNQTRRGDTRVTRVGEFLRANSLDELPQLLNILRGDMHIIGPRAHPCGMRVEGKLCEDLNEDYVSRHRIKPGITGLAQVMGQRGAVETSEQLDARTRLDNAYINGWSLALDLQIFLRTIPVCIKRTNAF
jgi:lipopolysaccharide/colanic/teichoic acid biosynthesis glycosyltransferase